MILRSPTDIGFGQLLMNSMFCHHEESLALLDIICNENAELRQYMVRAFTESLMASLGESRSVIADEHNYAARLVLLDESSSTSSAAVAAGNAADVGNQPRNMFGFDWIFNNVNSRLFRTPDQLPELRQTVLSSYVVLVELGNVGGDPDAAVVAQDDHSMDISDSIEDVRIPFVFSRVIMCITGTFID